MSRPNSQLAYTRIQDDPGEARTPTVITLHKHRQHGADVADFARIAAPQGRLLGLESYKGVFVGREIVGYTWYVGPLTRPAPVFFGDALGEIERFLWDERERQGVGEHPLPFLLGVEQGAIMALAAALAVPDLLSGVIAVGGQFPVVPGWDPPLAPLENLPVLVIDPDVPVAEQADVLNGDSLVSAFTGWGANITRHSVSDIDAPSDAMSSWLAQQPVRTAASS